MEDNGGDFDIVKIRKTDSKTGPVPDFSIKILEFIGSRWFQRCAIGGCRVNGEFQ